MFGRSWAVENAAQRSTTLNTISFILKKLRSGFISNLYLAVSIVLGDVRSISGVNVKA
jgi:hypothetical protein